MLAAETQYMNVLAQERVRVQEFQQGDWAIGGQRLRAADVHAKGKMKVA